MATTMFQFSVALHHDSRVRKAVKPGRYGQHLEKSGEGAQLGSTGLTHQVHLLRVAPVVGNLLQHPVDARVHILQHVHNCALHNPNYLHVFAAREYMQATWSV